MTLPLQPGSVRLMLIRDVDTGVIVDAEVFFTADAAERARADLLIGLDGSEFRDFPSETDLRERVAEPEPSGAQPVRVERDAAAWADKYLTVYNRRAARPDLLPKRLADLREIAQNAYLDGYDAGREDTRAGIEPWQERPDTVRARQAADAARAEHARLAHRYDASGIPLPDDLPPGTP